MKVNGILAHFLLGFIGVLFWSWFLGHSHVKCALWLTFTVIIWTELVQADSFNDWDRLYSLDTVIDIFVGLFGMYAASVLWGMR